MAKLADAFVEITADAKKFHAEADKVKKELEELKDKRIKITLDSQGVLDELRKIRREIEALNNEEFTLTLKPVVTKGDLQEELNKFNQDPPKVRVHVEVLRSQLESAIDQAAGALAPLSLAITPVFTPSGVQRALLRAVPLGKRPKLFVEPQFLQGRVLSEFNTAVRGAKPSMLVDVEFSRAQLLAALAKAAHPRPVIDVNARVSAKGARASAKAAAEAAAEEFNTVFNNVLNVGKSASFPQLEGSKDLIKGMNRETLNLVSTWDQLAFRVQAVGTFFTKLFQQLAERQANADFIKKQTDGLKELTARGGELVLVEDDLIGKILEQGRIARETAADSLRLHNKRVAAAQRERAEIETLGKAYRNQQRVLAETERLRIASNAATLAALRAQKLALSDALRGATSFHGILGQTISRAFSLSKIKFDNLNQLFGNALAADSLLNVLGNIFEAASKVRRIAVQMGAALATAFAVGAQATGALISGLGRASTALEALAGIGVIAIGVKLLLNEADVKAAKDNLVSTFKEVGTRAAEPLREPLKNFFNDLSGTVRNLEPTFNKFFKTVQPGFEKLGKSINDTLNSPQFQELFDRLGASANKFLEGLANKLPAILSGFLKITAALKAAGARIREAFGPGILDGLSADKVVAGINGITNALVSAGPGVRAFKTAFGQAFDALKTSLKGILATIGEVGPALFGALGPITAQVVTSAGQIAESFIRLASEVFPAVQQNAEKFVSTFGTNFSQSIELLAGPLSDVANAALELGTNLAPLLPILSQILINLDPIATGFLNLLNTLTPLALAIASFAENFAQGFGSTFSGILTVITGIANVISTVLTPAINLLSGPLGNIIGGFVGIVAPVLLLTTTFAKLSTVAATASAKLATVAASGSATGRALQILNTGWKTSETAARGAARNYVEAAQAAKKSAAAIKETGAAGRVAAAGFTAQASGLRSFAAANLAAANGSRAAAVGFRLQGAAMTSVGAGARLAGTAMRGVGAAFRFALGPIGLILIGIEALIAAFKGLVEVGGGVIDVLKGNFSEGFKKIGQGAKDAAKGIKDHFLGTGDEVEGTLNNELAGVEPNTESLVGKFAGVKVDIAAAMKGTGPLVSEQLRDEFSKLDIAEKIKGLQALKEAGKAFTDTVIDNIPRRNAVANLLEGLGLDGLAAQMRETGFIGIDQLRAGIEEALPALQQALADKAVDAATARQFLDSIKSLGLQVSPELLKGLQEAAGEIGPGISKTLSDAVPDSIPIEQQKQNAIAQGFVKTITDAIGSADVKAAVLRSFAGAFNSEEVSRQLGQQINGALGLAFSFVQQNPGAGGQTTAAQNAILATFDKAFSTFPNSQLGDKFGTLMGTAFKFAIASGGTTVAPQIIATMSLAFDTAFATLPTVLGSKISFMLGAAFATSIGSNVGILGPQITETLSLAFDAAFALLPGVLGPKLSQMFTTLFSTAVIDGVSLAASFQRVFTGALGLAFINLPAVIGPQLSNALNQGANQALSTFGLGLQGSINQAFATAFSGVGEAINGPLSAAFLGATGSAETFATTIGGSMTKAADNIRNAINPLATDIPQPFSDGFGEAVRVTQNQLDTLVNSVKTAKSQIDAIDFYGSGYAIGSRLAQGIRDATTALVIPAADDMAAAVKDRTPNSPAKKGPLSGPGDPLRTGANIVKRLVAGMQEQQPQLISAITKLVQEFSTRSSGIDLASLFNGLNVGVGAGSNRFGFGNAGQLGSGAITGNFNKNIGGRILQQDTQANLSTKPSNVLQIRPGQVNILVPGTNDPREWINDMSRELMTNCIGR